MRTGFRRRLNYFLIVVGSITAGGMLFGGIVAVAYFPNHPFRAVAFGILSAAIPGVLIASLVAGGEIFLPRTRLGLALERAPFMLTFGLKALVYSAATLVVLGSKIGRRIAAYVVFGSESTNEAIVMGGFPVAVSILVLFMAMSSAILSIEFSRLVGPSALRDIILGRYHRSRTEERFFLFVDIVGSTPLAERIGPDAIHGFLNRVFRIASDPVDDLAGEVYQYVGDEMVITWTIAEGRPDARPIACYFAIREALAEAAAEFEREFGTVPRLRAALHAGPVITGEVGGSRRAIVFHGDVMNTTSRIENATRELGHPFLVSADAVDRMEGSERYALTDLGMRQLRGREAAIQLFAVEHLQVA